MTDLSDPLTAPKHRQISADITRRIAAGRLAEGERLPPEREMAAEYGIAVGTLRRALSDLAEEGLIERRQGSGTYVRRLRGTGGLYGFFRIELRGGGGHPTAEVLDAARHPKPADAPAFGPAHDAHRIRRLRRLDGRPAVLEEIWLDASWAPALVAADLDPSLYRHYRRELGLRIVRVEDRVGAATMPDWGAPHLTAGIPCGRVDRLSWAHDGTRAEWSCSFYDSDAAAYVARLT